MIAAEGEWKASHALKEAADVITESPFAVQLRYLQTLGTISAEKNSTIIFPLPVDLITHFMRDGTTTLSSQDALAHSRTVENKKNELQCVAQSTRTECRTRFAV